MTPIDKQSFAATSAEEARPAALKTQIALPEHLVAMPGGQWTLWRWACLRGARFPSHLIEKLAGPACPSAADLLLRMEQEAGRKQDELIAALQRELQNAVEEARRAAERATRAAEEATRTHDAAALAALVDEVRRDADALAADVAPLLDTTDAAAAARVREWRFLVKLADDLDALRAAADEA